MKTKQWAKLAKNPKKATAKALEKALEELKSDRAALVAAKAQLEDRLKDAYLDSMAGEQVDLKALEGELFSMTNELVAMEAAQGRLEQAVQEAKVREAQARLEKVTQEIQKVKERIPGHYEKGLHFLSQALAYLGSAQGFDGANLPQGAEALARRANDMALDYATAFEKAPKPHSHLRGKLAQLEQERVELEKALKVGSYKPSKPREVVEEPPKLTFFGI